MYDCDATALLNIYSYLVFVGKGHLALVPSHLPHLRLLILDFREDVRDEDVEEIVAAAPELTVMNAYGYSVGAMTNKLLESTYACCFPNTVYYVSEGGSTFRKLRLHSTGTLNG